MKTRKAICGYDIADGELCRDTKLDAAGHCKKHAPEYEPQHTPPEGSHTPTPWTLEDRVIKSVNGANVSGLVPSRMTNSDAAFIVRAVNAYEKDQEIKRELLEAAIYTLNNLEAAVKEKLITATMNFQVQLSESREMLKQAIAKAGEK